MRFKRMLSILLVCLLCLGCGVSAAALPEGETVEAQSLPFYLRTITGIEVEWNGEILLYSDLLPFFSPYYSINNITITVYFDEGEPESLFRMYDYGEGWSWRISEQFDSESGTVAFEFLYEGSDRNQSASCSFPFPADYLEQYIETQKPLTAMKLSEAVIVEPNNFRPQVLAFTPEKTGRHSFEIDHGINHLILRRLFDSDMNPVSLRYDSLINASLEAGETYYLFVRNDYEEALNITVTKFSLWNLFLATIASIDWESPRLAWLVKIYKALEAFVLFWVSLF